MTTKTKAKRPILDAMHETARDLHSAGLIDTRRMRHYDALCLAPVPEYSSKKSAHCGAAITSVKPFSR